MNLFDIVGPVMVGPSSSHTAGAVKIGYISYRLLGEDIKKVNVLFHGSFALTGKGHGTDRAIIAGLLGMQPDDERIPYSFEIARENEIEIFFGTIVLNQMHPNTVKLELEGKTGKRLDIVASSTGGGRIKICQIDGIETNFGGNYPTLIVHNIDQPGHVTEVTSMLGHKSVNIATMQLFRESRGGKAVMVIECDQEIPIESVKWLEHLEGIIKVSYLSLEE
ncbi:L-serine ammonia-lyase, iron-sulfur-dependent subunit beta [Anaerosacchariphilus polymeriproducens]|uniref:L-serine deaminase n=1 Tax=Anaerosacchariphilus polymeriproducens TaxID=1812858 RepID=A0A371AZ37_9FIRM|nr:L-serine ammonia-lyase, iron-sulfur-dependent subunit beta [Anaerosacchariphilus polymeriproducens]RDU24813.1 L-serine ammonia-lyase, iron-sulfur-dependent, subunit beta [Anaerosacchariphilus polymeriproducens]